MGLWDDESSKKDGHEVFGAQPIVQTVNRKSNFMC